MKTVYDNLMLDKLNYHNYLRLPELLSLQTLMSTQKRGEAHHDEMFFIIIHQTAELWFKEILHETTILVQAFQHVCVSKALKALKRIKAIMNLQIKQIRMLSTLTPFEFAGFRDCLGTGSGFQSQQFREIEFTYGLRNPFFLRFFEKLPAAKERLAKIQKQPSVYDEFLMSIDKDSEEYTVPSAVLTRNVQEPHQPNEELVDLILKIYQGPQENYHWVLLIEGMLDLDQAFILWRKTHAVMVERTIGHLKGTGGSAGFEFLESREGLKCFPELWEVRNRIGGGYSA